MHHPVTPSSQDSQVALTLCYNDSLTKETQSTILKTKNISTFGYIFVGNIVVSFVFFYFILFCFFVFLALTGRERMVWNWQTYEYVSEAKRTCARS